MGSGNELHYDVHNNVHKRKAKQSISHGEVVVHFRCKYCGKIQPSITLNSDDLVHIAEEQGSKDAFMTCDACYDERR